MTVPGCILRCRVVALRGRTTSKVNDAAEVGFSQSGNYQKYDARILYDKYALNQLVIECPGRDVDAGHRRVIERAVIFKRGIIRIICDGFDRYQRLARINL